MSRSKGLRFDENRRYFDRLNLAIMSQCRSPAIAAVSPEPVSDTVWDALVEPFDNALAAMEEGKATYYNYWHCILTLSLYCYMLKYVLSHEKFGFEVESHTEGWLKEHERLLSVAEGQYVEVLDSIGKRHAKFGKYGMTGDERRLLGDFRRSMDDLLSWGSVRMVYHAVKGYKQFLLGVENRRRKQLGN